MARLTGLATVTARVSEPGPAVTAGAIAGCGKSRVVRLLR